MSIKFIANLPETLKVGQIIEIAGKLTIKANSFDVNLASGRTMNGNIPLQLSWLHTHKHIVRNTRDYRGWGTEERNQSSEFDAIAVQRGHDFNFKITVQHCGFNIEIDLLNSETDMDLYCMYQHRLPISEVRTIIVNGDVEFIRYLNQRNVIPRYLSFDYRSAFLQRIPNPLKTGTIIIITGRPTGSPDGRFVIALRKDTGKKHVLHIASRFGVGIVVQNKRISNGKWGKEKPLRLPFVLNQTFCIAIGFFNERFHIAIDGHNFADIDYPTDAMYKPVHALKVKGYDGLNVNITGVDYVHDQYGHTSNLHLLDQFSLLDNNPLSFPVNHYSSVPQGWSRR